MTAQVCFFPATVYSQVSLFSSCDDIPGQVFPGVHIDARPKKIRIEETLD